MKERFKKLRSRVQMAWRVLKAPKAIAVTLTGENTNVITKGLSICSAVQLATMATFELEMRHREYHQQEGALAEANHILNNK